MAGDFWANAKFEPKQNYRWKVEVLDGQDRPVFNSFYAKSVQKPNFSIEVQEYNLINRKINHPTNVKWEPIEIVFIDDQKSTVIKYIQKYLNSINYRDTLEKNSIGIDTTSKLDGRNSMKNIIISQLDSEGKQIETWTLINPQIAAFANASLDYSDDALTTYSFTITYDWAYLETA